MTTVVNEAGLILKPLPKMKKVDLKEGDWIRVRKVQDASNFMPGETAKKVEDAKVLGVYNHIIYCELAPSGPFQTERIRTSYQTKEYQLGWITKITMEDYLEGGAIL